MVVVKTCRQGVRVYWTLGFLTKLSDALLDFHLNQGMEAPQCAHCGPFVGEIGSNIIMLISYCS